MTGLGGNCSFGYGIAKCVPAELVVAVVVVSNQLFSRNSVGERPVSRRK